MKELNELQRWEPYGSDWPDQAGEMYAYQTGRYVRFEDVEEVVQKLAKKARKPLQIELDSETRWILGRPCFTIGGIAQDLRLLGHDIERKAEDEQAAAIHWMLNLYFKVGSKWRKVGERILRDAREKRK